VRPASYNRKMPIPSREERIARAQAMASGAQERLKEEPDVPGAIIEFLFTVAREHTGFALDDPNLARLRALAARTYAELKAETPNPGWTTRACTTVLMAVDLDRQKAGY
jgi:hypothetical protein